MKTALQLLSLSTLAIFASVTAPEAAENYVIRANGTVITGPAGTTVAHVAGGGVYEITATLGVIYRDSAPLCRRDYFVRARRPNELLLGGGR